MRQKSIDKVKRHILVGLLLATDILIVSATPFLAFWLRFEGNISSYWLELVWQQLPLIICVRIAMFYLFRLYHRVWRYASINELMVIVTAVSAGTIVLWGITQLNGVVLPRSVWLLSWLLNVMLIGASRLVLRVYYYLRNQFAGGGRSRVLIVGAGDAGAMIARELLQRYQRDKELVGFVDDDPSKKFNMLLGVKILGNCDELPAVASRCHVDEIIVAIPSASGAVLRKIVQQCKKLGCQVKTLPGIFELIDGKVTVIAKARGDKVILLYPHFTAFEAAVYALNQDQALISMYSHQKNQAMDAQILKGRHRYNNVFLIGRTEGLRAIIKKLKASSAPFVYLPDQDFGRKESVFVDFFGIPTATIAGLSRIAALTGAKVIPAIPTRRADGHVDLRFYAPWADFPGSDLLADTQRMNDFIEARVREQPEQYFWLHKRFKTRPEGEAAVYSEIK